VKVRRSLLKDTVTVRPYSGEGAYGPVYGAARTVRCDLDDTRRLVVTAAGDEVVTQATLTVHPDDAPLFVPESTIVIAGQDSRVLTAGAQLFRGRPAYVKVTCV